MSFDRGLTKKKKYGYEERKMKLPNTDMERFPIHIVKF